MKKKYGSGHTTLQLSGSGRRKGIKVWQESNEQQNLSMGDYATHELPEEALNFRRAPMNYMITQTIKFCAL